MLQSTQESVCLPKFELHDPALDKDIDRQHMTVERTLRDTRPYNVNASNQDDQYVMQCEGENAAFSLDDFRFEAHCHVGLTCQMQGALERQHLSCMYLAHSEPQSIIIIINNTINNCYY